LKKVHAESEKGRLEIDPVTATQAHKLITELMGMSPDLKNKLGKMLRAEKK
jgi:hypothetical protein